MWNDAIIFEAGSGLHCLSPCPPCSSKHHFFARCLGWELDEGRSCEVCSERLLATLHLFTTPSDRDCFQDGMLGTGASDVQQQSNKEFLANGVSLRYNMSALQVTKALAGKFSNQQIHQAVTHLVDEGHLYTTIDEFHFKFAGV